MVGISNNGIEWDNMGYVKKKAFGKDAVRLWNGIQKQIAFKQSTCFIQLKTPQIHWEKWNGDGSYEVKMEGISKYHYPLQSGNLLWMALAKQFIDRNLGGTIDQRVISANEVAKRVMRKTKRLIGFRRDWRGLVEEAYDIFGVAFATDLPPLPVGDFHGDFTTCNMLCVGDAVYLLDFLDCVIPSPVADVAKIRQDTAHGYAQLFLCNVDEATQRQADGIWVSLWEYETWWRYVPILTLWHLVRIIPYAPKNPIVKDWVGEAISEGIKNVKEIL